MAGKYDKSSSCRPLTELAPPTLSVSENHVVYISKNAKDLDFKYRLSHHGRGSLGMRLQHIYLITCMH